VDLSRSDVFSEKPGRIEIGSNSWNFLSDCLGKYLLRRVFVCVCSVEFIKRSRKVFAASTKIKTPKSRGLFVVSVQQNF